MQLQWILPLLATLAGQAPEPPAVAQQPPSSPAPPAITAGWRDGFFIQTAGGDFRLQVGALVHGDGRFAADDESQAVTDTFLVRRLRPYLRGRLAQRFEFYLNPDFAGGAVTVQDAYIDTIFSPAFRIRAGKGKTPFGLERLQSAANMLFVERALPTSLVPNRDIGVQVMGEVRGGLVSYAAGVLNGVADGASADVDGGDSKDAAGRVLIRPFSRAGSGALRGLAVGIAGTTGRQSGAAALPTFRTASLQQPYFSYATGSTADGTRRRVAPQASFHYRTLGLLAEYVSSELPVRRGSVRREIGHRSWQLAASIALTGEQLAADGSVRPRTNFDFGNGHVGALQVAVRFHRLSVDEQAFTLNLAAAGASRTADAWTAGVNWYLSPYFKYVIDFERTVFGGGDGTRPPENAVVFRTQLSF